LNAADVEKLEISQSVGTCFDGSLKPFLNFADGGAMSMQKHVIGSAGRTHSSDGTSPGTQRNNAAAKSRIRHMQ
jgi:hypothetical protein